MILDFNELEERLFDVIKNSSSVFVVGHVSPDYDSIGACLGIKEISNFLGKNAYIIVDCKDFNMEKNVKKIIDEKKSDNVFIDFDDALNIIDDKSCLIVVDVNKKKMIPCSCFLDKFKSVVVIDHHNLGEDSLVIDDLFVSLDSSSACEIVARILFDKNIKISKDTANNLLSGISLDTKRFKILTSGMTHVVAGKLIESGADLSYVNSLFKEDFANYCRINNLIINGTIIREYMKKSESINISFTLNRDNPGLIYLKEDYAKASDRMLKFDGIDASFVMGYVDNENIHVSSRSEKKVDVGKIMEVLGGGGTVNSAGALIKCNDIYSVERKIMGCAMDIYSKDDFVIDVKEKRLNRNILG